VHRKKKELNQLANAGSKSFVRLLEGKHRGKSRGRIGRSLDQSNLERRRMNRKR